MASKEAQVNLSKRILEYYKALPKVEPGSDTERNRAVAMIRYASAARFIDRLDEAGQLLKDARTILERRRAAGDQGEATAQALGLGLLGERRLLWAHGDVNGARNAAMGASRVLAPWALRDKASTSSLRLYAEVMSSLAWTDGTPEESLGWYEAARHAYQRLRAANPHDAGLAIDYVLGMAEGLWTLTDPLEAEAVGREAFEVGTQLLKARPGDTAALNARAELSYARVVAANSRGQVVHALAYMRNASSDYGSLLRLDPRDTNVRSNLSGTQYDISNALLRAGQPLAALQARQRALSISLATVQNSHEIAGAGFSALLGLAELNADLGDRAAASELLRQARTAAERMRMNHERPQLSQENAASLKYSEAVVALWNGNPQEAVASAQEGKAIARQIGGDPHSEQVRTIATAFLDAVLGQALLAQDQTGQALAVLADRASFLRTLNKVSDFVALREDFELLRATAIVGAGLDAQARQLLDQLVPQQRRFVADNPEDCRARLHLAVMLALQARIEPENATTAAREAAALVKALPEPMKRLRSVRIWLARIDAFTGKRAAA
jgi:hypothetical protein